MRRIIVLAIVVSLSCAGVLVFWRAVYGRMPRNLGELFDNRYLEVNGQGDIRPGPRSRERAGGMFAFSDTVVFQYLDAMDIRYAGDRDEQYLRCRIAGSGSAMAFRVSSEIKKRLERRE